VGPNISPGQSGTAASATGRGRKLHQPSVENSFEVALTDLGADFLMDVNMLGVKNDPAHRRLPFRKQLREDAMVVAARPQVETERL
jgi:hypothetical protein